MLLLCTSSWLADAMEAIKQPERDKTLSNLMDIEADLGARARVTYYIKQLIDDGKLGPGQPLPSGRELSRKLEVNPRTVRGAIDLLIEEGLVRSNGARLNIVSQALKRSASVSSNVSMRLSSLLENTIIVLSVDPVDTAFAAASDRVSGTGYGYDPAEIGAFQAIRAQGLNVLAMRPEHLDAERLANLKVNPPFGIIISEIFATAMSSRLAARIRRNGIPVVVYGNDPEMAAFDRVTCDQEAGAAMLTRCLLERGRRRLRNAWVTAAEPNYQVRYWLPERRKGYESAMREAGLEPLPEIVVPISPYGNAQADNFQQSVRHYVGYLAPYLIGPDAVDALLLDTDGFLPDITAACRLLGREPNKDIDIVGFDNYWKQLPHRDWEPAPPVATIDKKLYTIGQEMVNLLVERVQSPRGLDAPPQLRTVAPDLVVPEKE